MGSCLVPYYYRKQTKLREGNVFRGVCLSTVGVSVWGVSVQAGLCLVWSLSRGSFSRGVSVREGWGLCQGLKKLHTRKQCKVCFNITPLPFTLY